MKVKLAHYFHKRESQTEFVAEVLSTLQVAGVLLCRNSGRPRSHNFGCVNFENVHVLATAEKCWQKTVNFFCPFQKHAVQGTSNSAFRGDVISSPLGSNQSIHRQLQVMKLSNIAQKFNMFCETSESRMGNSLVCLCHSKYLYSHIVPNWISAQVIEELECRQKKMTIKSGSDQHSCALVCRQREHNATSLYPCMTVKQWKLCQRASTCANVLTKTSLRIK